MLKKKSFDYSHSSQYAQNYRHRHIFTLRSRMPQLISDLSVCGNKVEVIPKCWFVWDSCFSLLLLLLCLFLYSFGCVCAWVFWNMIFFKTGVRPSFCFCVGRKCVLALIPCVPIQYVKFKIFFIHFPYFAIIISIFLYSLLEGLSICMYICLLLSKLLHCEEVA